MFDPTDGTQVCKIKALYSGDVRRGVSEHAAPQTLKQMGYRGGRRFWAPVLSAEIRKTQRADDQHNWTAEDCENDTWSKESGFLLQHTDCGITADSWINQQSVLMVK